MPVHNETPLTPIDTSRRSSQYGWQVHDRPGEPPTDSFCRTVCTILSASWGFACHGPSCTPIPMFMQLGNRSPTIQGPLTNRALGIYAPAINIYNKT